MSIFRWKWYSYFLTLLCFFTFKCFVKAPCWAAMRQWLLCPGWAPQPSASRSESGPARCRGRTWHCLTPLLSVPCCLHPEQSPYTCWSRRELGDPLLNADISRVFINQWIHPLSGHHASDSYKAWSMAKRAEVTTRQISCLRPCLYIIWISFPFKFILGNFRRPE